MHTIETRQKISNALKKLYFEQPHKHSGYLSIEERERRERESERLILSASFDSLSLDKKRKRVWLEQEGRCARCKLSEWLGSRLMLELDHKNGNHTDNSRGNIEFLCPNCHSQTGTWRGRNKGHNGNKSFRGEKKVSDDAIVAAFKETGNIRQALLTVGLAPKGNNYKRCKKLLDIFVVN